MLLQQCSVEEQPACLGCGQPIELVARPDSSSFTALFKKTLGDADPTFPVSAPNWGGVAKVRLAHCDVFGMLLL